MVSAGAGALTLIGQIFVWFKLGAWYPISLTLVLDQVGASITWLKQHLVGLQRIFDGMVAVICELPASMFLLFVGPECVGWARHLRSAGTTAGVRVPGPPCSLT